MTNWQKSSLDYITNYNDRFRQPHFPLMQSLFTIKSATKILYQYYMSVASEFKISAKPINAGDKMAAPRQQPMSVCITLSNAFFQSKPLQ